MLKKMWMSFLCLVSMYSGFLCLAYALPPQVGCEMPGFELPVPEKKADSKYLGISTGKKKFTVNDVKAEVVIVEVFSMYCPHCQRGASHVNKLYEAIKKDPKLKDRIKILGIGIGNTLYEVNFFKKKYKIPFPLIPDGEFKLYKEIGVKRTPYFIVVKILDTGKSQVLYSKPGGFGDTGKFLKTILELSGFERDK